MSTRRVTLHALATGALSLAAGRAFGQDDKSTITVLVGASSSMDMCARVIADQLRDSLGRTTLALSRLGAGQRVALGEVRRAPPDGRTLCFATNGPFSIYPHIYTKLDYDPDRDFTFIAGISSFDVAISTGPMTGAADLKQLIAWAKSHQAEAVFGSAPGNGSLSHFLGISVNVAAGLNMTHVPYKDSGVGMIDLASGRLPIMITGLNPQIELHKAGKTRLLAVSGEARSPLVPEVPTLKEAGVNVSASTLTGVFGPPKMPPELVSRIYAALQPMFSNPATKEKLGQQGMRMMPMTGPQLQAAMIEERKRVELLVKASGMQPEAS